MQLLRKFTQKAQRTLGRTLERTLAYTGTYTVYTGKTHTFFTPTPCRVQALRVRAGAHRRHPLECERACTNAASESSRVPRIWAGTYKRYLGHLTRERRTGGSFPLQRVITNTLRTWLRPLSSQPPTESLHTKENYYTLMRTFNLEAIKCIVFCYFKPITKYFCTLVPFKHNNT